jgi:hypothetical protein
VFAIACSPCRDDPNCRVPPSPNDSDEAVANKAGGQKSLLPLKGTSHFDRGPPIKDTTSVDEVNAVLVEIALLLGVVPFKDPVAKLLQV